MACCKRRGDEGRGEGRKGGERRGNDKREEMKRGGEQTQRSDDSCRLKLEPVEPQGQSGEELL